MRACVCVCMRVCVCVCVFVANIVHMKLLINKLPAPFLAMGKQPQLFVGWLVAKRPSNMLVYLRDVSAWTILHAASPR